MKTGLVMEGGAMRGMFTCGVIDVLMEENISFDGSVGVSAGACFGCNIKSRQIGRAIRYNKRFCNDPRYCGIRSFLTTGDLYNARFCYETLPQELDVWDVKTFAENPHEFYVTATDVTTGRAVFHKCTDGGHDDILWIRASASMPIVSRIVEVGGYRLLDGGIGDSIPLGFMESKGYDRNVVIMTQPLSYRKEKNSLMPLIRVCLHDYPETVKALADRHIRYNKELDYIRKEELEGKVLVIRPPKALEIGSTEKDPAQLERVYQIGRRTGRAYAGKIRDFLKE